MERRPASLVVKRQDDGFQFAGVFSVFRRGLLGIPAVAAQGTELVAAGGELRVLRVVGLAVRGIAGGNEFLQLGKRANHCGVSEEG